MMPIVVFATVLAFATIACPQSRPTQNARQALLEMFFSKTPGTFDKHLPEATRAALRKGDGQGLSLLQQFSLLSSQINSQGQQLQTFEAGPTLVIVEDSRINSKFDVSVERDDLGGESDEIELSFHAYKDGRPQASFVSPHLTFLMKEQTGIWRLNEITVAVHMALDNPEFLNQMTKNMTNLAGANMANLGGARSAANESAAVSSLRTLNTAEITYAATYPNRGYTCSLWDLDGFGSSQASEHHAMLIDSNLATGKKAGYVFMLSGCAGSPASTFKATAVPAEPALGARSLCSDQTAVIRYSVDGKPATCLSSGKPLN
jgi:type IV pilus assembly protein PilA